MNPLLSSIIVWEPAFPTPAILALGLALGLLAWRVCLRGPLSLRRNWLLFSLRAAAVLLLCVLLMNPHKEESIPQRHPRRVALVAVDKSLSMAEKDTPDGVSRLDATRQMIVENQLNSPNGLGEIRLSALSDQALTLGPAGLAGLRADGDNTLLHTSLAAVLRNVRQDEHCVGLFLFSDGHDFEGASAAKTAAMARAARTPIFPIPVGTMQTHADLAIHMISHQNSTYVKQVASLSAMVSSTATNNRQLRVELLREGKLLRDQKITLAAESEAPVSFEVSEDAPGQQEYELRVSPLTDERNVDNNSALTFLNVTDSKLRVLLVESEPHWDTAFIQRTLARNDRMELDSMISLGEKNLKISRPADAKGEFTPPATVGDFTAYSLVILGKRVDRILSPEALLALKKSVEDHQLTLVMARGRPCEGAVMDSLSPAVWGDGAVGDVRMTSKPGRAEILPVDVLKSAPGGMEALPELPLLHDLSAPKPLTQVESVAGAGDAPAILHRRQGSGQVLAFAVEGLWKYGLNAKNDQGGKFFDRFWNQTIINLLARSGRSPGTQARLTISSANVSLGEKAVFRLQAPLGKKLPDQNKVTIFRGSESVAEIPLTLDETGASASGGWVPEKVGRYAAETTTLGGKAGCRFACHLEQSERTDTALNIGYLRGLAEASGGKMLERNSLPKTVADLQKAAVTESQAPPILRRTPLWDNGLVFLVLAALLGSEWFLRRRWGLT